MLSNITLDISTESNIMLKFITGNRTKFKEIQTTLNPIQIEQIDINLNEIQEIDSHKIIQHKLQEALKHQQGEFIIDDSSLFLSCFGYKLPGPLIKWFNTTIGSAGIYHLCQKMGDYKAKAITIIGYAKDNNEIQFFKGELQGKIVALKGDYSFGYDPIFLPEGSSQTLSEMKAENNFESSPRGLAVKQLKEFLLKQ